MDNFEHTDHHEPTRAVAAGEEEGPDTFYLVPHSHWEGAVFQTREQYLEIGWPIILRALRLLEIYPSYRFVLDQVCLVKPFLERHPEQAAAFRRFVDEGRLAIVGGLLVMPDVNMPGGESFVRQVLVGKRWFRKALGVEVDIGWQLDTFGHHAQIPQLMRQAGYKSIWTQRGAPDGDLPTDLIWEGLDGTRIPFYWLAKGYGLAYESPATLPDFSGFMRERYDRLGPHSLGPGRCACAGFDVSLPEAHLPVLVEDFNRQEGSPFRIRIALPSDYEAAVEQRGVERPVIRGDLNPVFQGTYSSRIEIKQTVRELERLLTAAEKLGALLSALGEVVDHAALERAWEPTLFNQAHDIMSGVMLDHVYVDTLQGFDFSLRLAREELASRLAMLARRIDTRGEGIPVIVFNPLGWSRTDIVEANVAFVGADVRGLSVVGTDGAAIPVQVIQSQHAENGSLLRARIALVARDVPALGHAVYRVLPQSGAEVAAPSVEATSSGGTLANDRYRLDVDLATGAINGILVRDGEWEALAGPGNIVAQEEDCGDFWELHGRLPKGLVSYNVQHGTPKPGSARLSTDQTGTPGTVTRGPVFEEAEVSHPFGEQGSFRTAIRLYSELSRIDIRTRILNRDRYVRYRLVVPTTVRSGRNVHEIPFGAVERKDDIEFPAQTWVDRGDGLRGVALLNRGLPGNNCVDGTLLLSLMRTTCLYPKGADEYESGTCHETGFEEGKELAFEYALIPHTGDWQQAGIHREGQAFNNPLIACTAAVHPGDLPPRWGFLEVRHPGVVVSALKPGEDGGVILRMYEATGRAADGVAIDSALPIERVEEVNLVEDLIRPMDISHKGLSVDFSPFQIQTLRLQFGTQETER